MLLACGGVGTLVASRAGLGNLGDAGTSSSSKSSSRAVVGDSGGPVFWYGN